MGPVVAKQRMAGFAWSREKARCDCNSNGNRHEAGLVRGGDGACVRVAAGWSKAASGGAAARVRLDASTMAGPGKAFAGELPGLGEDGEAGLDMGSWMMGVQCGSKLLASFVPPEKGMDKSNNAARSILKTCIVICMLTKAWSLSKSTASGPSLNSHEK